MHPITEHQNTRSKTDKNEERNRDNSIAIVGSLQYSTFNNGENNQIKGQPGNRRLEQRLTPAGPNRHLHNTPSHDNSIYSLKYTCNILEDRTYARLF